MSHYSEQRAQQGLKFKSGLIAAAVELIAKEEGFRPAAYHCSEGYPTIGYGQKIGERYQPLSVFQFTLPEPVAKQWLTENIIATLNRFDDHPQLASAFVRCSQNRQIILISMAYQLGVRGLANFKKMLGALIQGDYKGAEFQALDSKWAEQTPNRAKRHAHTLRTGELI